MELNVENGGRELPNRNIAKGGLPLELLLSAKPLASYLLDSPMAAKCFNEDEKRLFITCVRTNETDIQNRKYKMYQVRGSF